MDLKIKGKKALITGSTAGIGYAIAELLASEGASVIINGRSTDSVESAIGKLEQTTQESIMGFVGDLSMSECSERLSREYPEVEILVNNLGIFEPVPFEDITDDDWLRFFETNVLSGVRLCRIYLPKMKEKNWGRIVFISSESGIQIPAEMIHYGMTKTAQLSISRGLAESVAGTNITVNSILPGPTKSRGVIDFVDELATKEGKSFDEIEKDFFNDVRPTSLIKRFSTPSEVASLVAYIVSPLASATTGAALRVDGGVIKSAF